MTDELAKRVVELCRPTMRKVIGDSTPAQYDRADEMARAIESAVRRAAEEVRQLPVDHHLTQGGWMDIIKEVLDYHEAAVVECLKDDPNIPIEDVRGTVWQSIIDDLQTAYVDAEKERHQVKLSGDTGRWVRLNDDYQDEVPAGAIGVIVREYRGQDDSDHDDTWDVFILRVPKHFDPCVAGTTISVPRGSQEILKEVR